MQCQFGKSPFSVTVHTLGWVVRPVSVVLALDLLASLQLVSTVTRVRGPAVVVVALDFYFAIFGMLEVRAATPVCGVRLGGVTRII